MINRFSLVLFLLLTAFSLEAVALKMTGFAKVEIVDPSVGGGGFDRLVANNDMNFGKILKPESGSVTAVVSDTGNLSGTAQYIDASGAPGTVDISGDSNETVSLVIRDTSVISGMSLDNFTGSFGGQVMVGNSLTGATLTGGIDILNIGASLTVDSTVSIGEHSPSYDVEVNYD